jgi:hypothetical protein
MAAIDEPGTTAVVVFMGSWVSSLFNWGNAGWLAVTLAGLALTVPLLLRGVVISARAAFVMFCSEALGFIILPVGWRGDEIRARVTSSLAARADRPRRSPGGARCRTQARETAR